MRPARSSNPRAGLAKRTASSPPSMVSKLPRRKSPNAFESVSMPRRRLAFPGAVGEQLVGLERDWWKQLVTAIFKPWGRFENFDAYFDELFAYFATPGAWSLYPEVLETLATLKKRGMILDVISNFDSRLVRILDGLSVADFIRTYFHLEPGWSRQAGSRDLRRGFKAARFACGKCTARRR